MNTKNLSETYYYVIYHCGPNGKEHPFFAKGKEWDKKFTSNLCESLVVDNLILAQTYADEMNKIALHKNHCLAGKIKVGRIHIEEMIPSEM